MIEDLVEYGNKNSFSDAAVALELLNSAIKGAYYNVKINLKDIQDKEYINQKLKESKDIILSVSKIYNRITNIINKEL